ncbi:barH-like 1 homeobox protein [Astyanax mexicanus]|uniref:BarH-like 1 homeobox protein n=1 Tax=Astyanax mexicanus TaxID=7994 RepID=A0A8T2M191_ASTMX|nr:barH-like 1 homeobox protein [Astyanax mexicanus]
MADWKMPVSYYNPSYHAYAYGLMYPQAPEQTHTTVSWAEAAYGPSATVTGGYYSPHAPSQSPPGSPECAPAGSNGHYPGSVVYYTDSQSHTQNGRLFFSNNRVQFDQQPKDPEADQAGTGSDTPSDSEAHTPDSWSSGSSREGGVPPAELDLPAWVKKEPSSSYELDGGSPDCTEVIPSSLSAAEHQSGFKVEEDCGLVMSPPGQIPSQPRKAKARTAFSEGQMNALTDRFNVQRYLTPAEMKALAVLTGLTYKQVKTWFQNRRMKLKRHQKDNSWVSERYITAGVPSGPPSHSQFQVDAPMLNQDLFATNPQFGNAVFKKSPPQTQPFYPNYTRPLSPSQVPSQVSSRPPGSWPLPPAVTHYEFPNPGAPVRGNPDAGNSADPSSSSSTQLATLHSATQWSS